MANPRKKPRDKPKYPPAQVRVGPNYKSTPKNPLVEHAKRLRPPCGVCELEQVELVNEARRTLSENGVPYGPGTARDGLVKTYGYKLDDLPSERSFGRHFKACLR